MRGESIRFAIVGLGLRGSDGWINTLAAIPSARLVAVCDPIAALRKRACELSGLSESDAHTALDDLLSRDDVDAVAVVVEPENAADVSAQALNAGKHVLCEVPAAVTLDQCWRLVDAVERSGKIYGLAEQGTFAPFTRAWRDIYRQGRLGRVLYGEAQYLHGTTSDRYWHDPETGARISWEQAAQTPGARKSRMWSLRHPIWYSPHSLGALLRVLDTTVAKVTCFSTASPSYVHPEVPNPDFEVALMHTTDDVILRIATCFTAPSALPYHWWHLFGTGGEVETGRLPAAPEDKPSNGGSLAWFADSYQRYRQVTDWDFTPYQPGTRLDIRNVRHGGNDVYPVEDFIRAVVTGEGPTIDVYKACDIAAPAIISAHSAEQGGRPLTVPNFRTRTRIRESDTHPTEI